MRGIGSAASLEKLFFNDPGKINKGVRNYAKVSHESEEHCRMRNQPANNRVLFSLFKRSQQQKAICIITTEKDNRSNRIRELSEWAKRNLKKKKNFQKKRTKKILLLKEFFSVVDNLPNRGYRFRPFFFFLIN